MTPHFQRAASWSRASADGRQPRRGSVMMEFTIVFPVLLVLLFSCVQFAHIWGAKQVVHYAAFCAARAALVHVEEPYGPSFVNDSWPEPAFELGYVGFDPQFTRKDSIANGIRSGHANSEAEYAGCKAAARVCAWVTMGGTGGITVPGWGEINGSDVVEMKTRAIVEFDRSTWNVQATVEHDFALVTPIVGPMLAWGMNPWAASGAWLKTTTDPTGDAYLSSFPFPHIRLKETVWMAKPYRTVIATGDWNGY